MEKKVKPVHGEQQIALNEKQQFAIEMGWRKRSKPKAKGKNENNEPIKTTYEVDHYCPALSPSG